MGLLGLLCGDGLVDSRLTVTVYEGDMCSSSNHKLFLGTGAAYVAPSVGLILASASLRDVHLQRLWSRYFTAFSSDCDRYSAALISFVLLWSLSPDATSVRRHTSFIRLFPAVSVSFCLTCSRALCSSSPLLSLNAIFMMVLHRARGVQETPRRIWKSFCYLCSKSIMRERE